MPTTSDKKNAYAKAQEAARTAIARRDAAVAKFHTEMARRNTEVLKSMPSGRDTAERLRMQPARSERSGNARNAPRSGRYGDGSASPGQLEAYSGSYQTTQQSRLRDLAPSLVGDARDHLDPWSHYQLRNISRNLLRNSPTARAMVNRLWRFIIGPRGIRPQAMTSDKAWNKKAEAWFLKWAERDCDSRRKRSLWLKQDIWGRSAARDGDIGIVFTSDGRLMDVEGDLIASPTSNYAENVFNGVEMDSAGAARAYFIGRRARFGMPSDFARIPERFAILYSMRANAWSSSVRGEPLLAAVAGQFDDLDEVRDATVVAARLAAMLAVVVKTENPQATRESIAGDTQVTEGVSTRTDTTQTPLGSGTITHLKVGESIEQVDPKHPGPVFDSFVRMMVRMIGADIGLPLELAIMDHSQTNFYGTRAAWLNCWKSSIEPEQNNMIDMVLKRVWRWRIGMAIDDGELEPNPEFESHDWVAEVMPEVDEKAAYTAKGVGVALRLTDQRTAIQELGDVYEDVMDNSEFAVKDMARRGIPPAIVQGVLEPFQQAGAPASDGQDQTEP
ncbi:MAG TPA: phage portal protein [Vicinamibacterales bacterium]|nr:phage portal protein [Vicinamibacterales bacterium]